MESNGTERLLIQIWLYVIKPFRITRILELFYALNWLSFFLLSLLPDKYVGGTVFRVMRDYFSHYQITLILGIIVLFSTFAQWFDNVIARKIFLAFNIFILMYIASENILKIPISSSSIFFVILIVCTIFVFWRMDIEE